MTAPVKKSFGNLPGPGPGRPKGLQNKNTTQLKDALLEAATKAGGKDGLVGYLLVQATANPGPFMALLGKVLPMQVTGDAENPLVTEIVIRGVTGASR
jgi:hypothetical protein